MEGLFNVLSDRNKWNGKIKHGHQDGVVRTYTGQRYRDHEWLHVFHAYPAGYGLELGLVVLLLWHEFVAWLQSVTGPGKWGGT